MPGSAKSPLVKVGSAQEASVVRSLEAKRDEIFGVSEIVGKLGNQSASNGHQPLKVHFL